MHCRLPACPASPPPCCWPSRHGRRHGRCRHWRRSGSVRCSVRAIRARRRCARRTPPRLPGKRCCTRHRVRKRGRHGRARSASRSASCITARPSNTFITCWKPPHPVSASPSHRNRWWPTTSRPGASSHPGVFARRVLAGRCARRGHRVIRASPPWRAGCAGNCRPPERGNALAAYNPRSTPCKRDSRTMDHLDVMRSIVGASNVLTGADTQAYETDWRERYHGQTLAVLRPGSTDEVAAIVRHCAQAAIPVVPQGGNTGLCGGATPDDSGRAVILSLQRMNRVRGIDTDNDTMEVEAGCILQAVQQAARDAGRLFPLSLAAEGSCTIGGNLATNAGGTQVLRYGNMRELTLGLEVVTAQGEVWRGLRGLRKDNTGYDLRDLFIGSEGTLGVITAATLKLYPLPVARCTALLGLDCIPAAITLLSRARAGFAASLTAFELMAGNCLHTVVRCFPQQQLPFDGPSAKLPWYALLGVSDSESEAHARARFEAVVGAAIEAGCVKDAVIAESVAQSRALWHLRESIPLAEKEIGKSIKHDISIPVSRMAEFVRDTSAALQAAFPGIELVIFGHLGDGNLHYNVAPGGDWNEAALLARQDAVSTLVHDRVHAAGGSISAEHGVGQLKRDALVRYKDPVALALMRSLKQALDPQGIMNPGKVLASVAR